MQNRPKKLLVLRFSSIGDIVLTSPVVRCLRQALPGLELHYLTKEAFRSIPANSPLVDKVYSFQKHWQEVLPELQREKYDYVVDLQHNLKSILLRKKLGVPSSSFPKLNVQKWLRVRFGIKWLPDIHIVDRYFEAVKPLGVSNDGQGLDFFIKVSERVVPELTFGWFKEQYVALVLGAAHFTKRIPAKKLEEICHNINMPIVLLGGKAEYEAGDKLAALFPGRVHNACGKCTLDQSASVIKHAKHVITGDTGLMHIAAAFQKPTTVLWGNTSPEFGMYPYMDNSLWQSLEVPGLSCRPCSKIGYEKCPKKHFRCMNDQDVSLIKI